MAAVLAGAGDDRGGLVLSASARPVAGTPRVAVGWTGVYVAARPARRVPPSASLATDHSGRAGALRTTRARSGLKCMCPRRQRESAGLRGMAAHPHAFSAGRSLRAGRWKTHSVRLPSPASLLAGRFAHGSRWSPFAVPCSPAGRARTPRSLARGLPLVGHAALGRTPRAAGWLILRAGALSLAPQWGRSRRRERERAADAVGRRRRGNRGLGPRCRALSRAPSEYCNVDYECKRENGFGGTDIKQ